MLDSRRLPIPGLSGWLVDARCRVFPEDSYSPLPCEWPFVTITIRDLSLSIKAPEAAALAFLGEAGCEAIFRELFSAEVGKSHPRVKAIALERGISAWIVIEAARRHFSEFRLTKLLHDISRGRIDDTMRLHRITDARVDDYRTFRCTSGGTHKGAVAHDHVISISGVPYRMRRSSAFPMARKGDLVSFSFRRDREGGLFIVNSTFSRVATSGSASYREQLVHGPLARLNRV